MHKRLPRFGLGLAIGLLIGLGAAILPPFYDDGLAITGAPAAQPAPVSPAGTAAAHAAPATPIAPVSRSFSLIAVGDILLSRGIGRELQERGWGYPFAGIAPLVSSADVAFCNLECPASVLGTPYPGKPEIVTFRASPAALFGLKQAGFDLVSLANNHMNDYGAPALRETIEALDLLGLAHSGAGLNSDEAHAPARLEVNGVRISLLSYAEPIWSTVIAGTTPGVASLDPERIRADIARERAHSDLVLVSLHWGEEHQGRPRPSDRELARSFVEAGASAILGHHPHVLQGVELYRGVPILYSLGNCVFDMQAGTTYSSAAARLRFTDGKLSELRLIPLEIDRKSFIPAPATGESRKAIAALILDRSGFLGTTLSRESDGSLSLSP